ncbi:MAG: hypothetical protein RBS19_09660 [Bacteroidales bacterium]|nr:hypothetical protein [Bacteroidales bacterium]
MNFDQGHLYHVYNQGNNKQRIFFSEKNYLYFIEKIRNHILPYADVVAWCLMPNHFHLLLHPCDSRQATCDSRGATQSHPCSTHQVTSSHQMSITSKEITNGIAITLRSYTRAINVQENSSGSLFRQKTKAICLTKNDTITPTYLNTSSGTLININTPQSQYPKICFDYIHKNPVKSGLVSKPENWEFSSAMEFHGIRNNGLVNIEIAKEFGLI